MSPPPPPTPTPDYRAARRWNVVWFVPILAVLIGGWMIWQQVRSQGPVAYVRFETADGIGAGKTEVRCRSVRVGVVKEVKLADDLKSVVVQVELIPDSDKLLRSGTSFWVVRPRVTASAVSGLDTLITGAYLELNPGPEGGEDSNHFNGFETPPATSRDIPGRRIVLTAEKGGSLVAGAPLYYRGFEVGRIESRQLDITAQKVVFDAYIREEFSSLVTINTRFWNTSGIDVSVGADGLKLRTPSFQALVSGGASFGVPEGSQPGALAADGEAFTLFVDEDAAQGSTFNPTMKFVLLFDQSVRGLSQTAPVEFKGIPIGRVADISFDYNLAIDDSRIPVLVEIDPSLLCREIAGKTGKSDIEFIRDAVKGGLRATLKAGSLLTGALFVDVNYFPDVAPAELTQVGEYPSIPTVPSGLEHMVQAALERFQNLPLEATIEKFAKTADQATTTLAEFKETAASIKEITSSEAFAQLPADLRTSLAKLDKLTSSLDNSVASYGPEGPIQGDLLRTLDELRAALRTTKSLMTGINEKPNSLLFGRDSSGNAIPKAPRVAR